MHSNNYYEILGLSKEASQEEIKKAYRKLSMEYHPDKNPTGEEQFKKINEAYETLGDTEKRRMYDTGGTRNTHDIFDEMFTFFHGGRAERGNFRQHFFVRGSDIRINLKVTTKESYFGSTKTIRYNRTIKNRTVTEETTIQVPKGIDNGAMLRMRHGGNSPAMGEDRTEFYGDLLVFIILEPDIFTKEDVNLIYDMQIDPIDLLIGKEEIVNHYDGDINVKIPENINPNFFLRVQGRGLNIGNRQGDLMIRLVVSNDLVLTEDLKNKLKKFKQNKPKKP